jgi:N-acetylmuramate 1-kinase
MRILTHFIKRHLPLTTGFTGRLRVRTLQGDGSDRKVYRLSAGHKTFIAISHPKGRTGSPSENDSFLYIALHLREKGLPTPLIYAFYHRLGCFLLEDFGDLSLESMVRKARGLEIIKRTYERLLMLLLKIQIQGAENFDPRYCYDTLFYDGLFSWKRESLYFLEAFLKGYRHYPKAPGPVIEELQELAFRVDQEELRLFLYRDFQSRNILVGDFGFGLIDFQAARLGPPQYDLASLLIDPYVNMARHMQEELYDFYLTILSVQITINPKSFREHYEIIAFQRNLQILGAYAFLSRIKGKTYFEQYIPAALSGLKRRLTAKIFQPYRHVRQLIARL